MMNSTVAKKLGKNVCIAACLASTSMLACTNDEQPGAGDDAETTGQSESALRPAVVDPVDDQLHPYPLDTATHCGGTRVWFDGLCRELSFFDRLRSAETTLVSVAGPRRKSAAYDTGVILTETVGRFGVQQVYLSPAKTSGYFMAGYLYRDGYPIVGSQTSTFWKDSAGLRNRFTEVRGPTGWPMRFGTLSWKHWIETPGGYNEFWSDGTLANVRAQSGVSGSDQAAICDAEGAASKASYVDACQTAVLTEAAGAIALGLTVGAAAAVAIFATGGLAAVPIATLAPAALSVIAIGGTAGGAGAVAVNTTKGKVCDAKADAAGLAAEAACLTPDPPPPATDLTFLAVPESGTADVNAPCPPGQVEWTGPARYCPAGGSDGASEEEDAETTDNLFVSQLTYSSNVDDGTVYEVVVVADPMTGPTCTQVNLTGQCAIVR